MAYTETGQASRFKKKDAVKNGFVYHFCFLDDGNVVVNDSARYIQDEVAKNSDSLDQDSRIIDYIKFQFNKAYDDVIFWLLNKDIEYHFCLCEKNQVITNLNISPPFSVI
mgnify:CR=1 FL=1